MCSPDSSPQPCGIYSKRKRSQIALDIRTQEAERALAPLTLNLSHDQEKFVKMTAQVLSEWLGSMGAFAWIVLGLLLVLALVALATVALRLLRGHTLLNQPYFQSHRWSGQDSDQKR
jgi:hypothetical protein